MTSCFHILDFPVEFSDLNDLFLLIKLNSLLGKFIIII